MKRFFINVGITASLMFATSLFAQTSIVKTVFATISASTANITSLVIGGVAGAGLDVSGSTVRVKAPLGYTTVLQGNGFNGWDISPHLTPISDANFSIGGYNTRVHNFYIKGNIKGGNTTTLTESSATTIYDVTLVDSTYSAGEFYYSVYATNGTANQLRSSTIRWSATREGATSVCAMNPTAPDETNDANASAIDSGTLEYDITCINVASTGIRFQINAVSSLTQTIFIAESRLNMLVAQVTVPE